MRTLAELWSPDSCLFLKLDRGAYGAALGCSSSLIDSEGRELRRWSLEPCDRWGSSTLLADGSVLAMHRNPTTRKTADQLRDATRTAGAASRS